MCIRPCRSSQTLVHPLHSRNQSKFNPPGRCQRRGVTQARHASKKGPSSTYHEQRARHGRAARDGSIVWYWTTWRRWPPFKTVSNLKFLASLYDVHRVEVDQLELICPHIHDALAAQAESFTSDQASRTIVYLSRLHMVPQASLWGILAHQIDAPTPQLLNPGKQRCLDKNRTPLRALRCVC